MGDTDVLLITSDGELRDFIAQRKPANATLRTATTPDAATDVRFRQLWLDLDTAVSVRVIPAERLVYLCSSCGSPPEGLPTGVHVRKPLTEQVLDLLWALALPEAVGPSADGRVALPTWLLEFQELRLATLCRRLVTGLAPRLGYREVSLYLHDVERQCLTLVESERSRPLASAVPLDAVGHHLMVAVARGGRLFLTDHTTDELAVRGIRRAEDRGYGDDACLIAPLCCDGELWGVLNFSGRARTSLTQDDLPLDELFAFLGGVLCHARLYDQARTEARVDSLTGLYNQRWMTESLNKEIRRAERFDTSLCVLMIDLNGLKTINDCEGHAAGDLALRHVASRITRMLRHFDGAARVGGDEFVIMLPGTNLRGAEHVAQRLLDSIRDNTAQASPRSSPITASIGAAEWRPGWNALQLLDAADRAMYRAKHAHHNGGASPDTTLPAAREGA